MIAGPRSLVHPILGLIGSFTVASMAIVVVGLGSGYEYSIINNNINTSSIKTIDNPMTIVGPRSAAVVVSVCHNCHSCHCRIAFQL